MTNTLARNKLQLAADILRAIAIGMCVMAGNYWLAAVLFVIP